MNHLEAVITKQVQDINALQSGLTSLINRTNKAVRGEGERSQSMLFNRVAIQELVYQTLANTINNDKYQTLTSKLRTLTNLNEYKINELKRAS